jgi:hypothetical protein
MSDTKPFSFLAKRVLHFSLPQLAFACVGVFFFAQTGEFTKINSVVNRFQTAGAALLYGPKFSHRTYRLKVEGTAAVKPEILVIGSSRTNQWRSAMFRPYRFYNGGNSVNTQKSYQRFLEEIGLPKPKVVIFSLDFFSLDDTWDSQYQNLAYDDGMDIGSPLYLKVLRSLMDAAAESPRKLIVTKEPIYSVSALGLNAAQRGGGFRVDGSYQYGPPLSLYKKNGEWDIEETDSLERIRLGKAPFVFGDKLSKERLRELEDFAAYAKANGITLIGITMPLYPTTLQSLGRSPRHNNWRYFNSDTMANWINKQGILYFNFSRIETFGGRAEEFVDAFHPSEPAYLRIFLTMMKDARMREIFKDISVSDIENRLVKATPLEAYYNDF